MGKIKWVVAVLVALYAMFYWKIVRNQCVYTGDVKLHGKTVIVTGGNSGIGKETALDLAGRGARVILACRSLKKAEDAAKEIKTRTGNSEVVVRQLELSSLQSVREFAKQINEQEKRLDILINNAGIGFDFEGSVTKDNFHTVFGINHFGHFLLTNLLLDLLKKTAHSRVVTVSSIVYSLTKETEIRGMARVDSDGASTVLYPGLKEYHTSKLANVLFARELAKREGPAGVVSVSLHPGTIYTPIWQKSMNLSSVWSKIYYILSPLFWLFLLDEEAGAQTTIYCALDESVGKLSGGYFENCALTEPSALALDDQLAEKLWNVSCEATGLKC